MVRLLPTPFIVTARRRRAALNTSTLFRTRNAEVRALARSSRRQMRRRPPQCQVPCREAATPCPRHTAALPSSSLTSMSASLADQRRTDEVSNPDWANHLPGHPASFVRFVRTVGSPQSCSGARYRRSTISGRFRERNLVGLDPQSKCFFSYQECGALMAAPVKQGPGRRPQDRTVAQLV